LSSAESSLSLSVSAWTVRAVDAGAGLAGYRKHVIYMTDTRSIHTGVIEIAVEDIWLDFFLAEGLVATVLLVLLAALGPRLVVPEGVLGRDVCECVEWCVTCA
jgi:hypothetical protein